jgi:hypothetical protein
MSRGFRIYLIIMGVSAGLAVAIPQLAFIGFLFGIVPGIFLSVAPAVFAYSLAWWSARAALLAIAKRSGLDPDRKFVSPMFGVLAAISIALPAVLVPQSINASTMEKAAELRADDHDHAGPIALPSIVAVLLASNTSKSADPKTFLDCETLCQRLLYNKAVSRVIVAEAPRPSGSNKHPRPVAEYRIEQRDQCPTPALSNRDVVWPVDQRARTVSRVRARIAAGECLIGEAGNIGAASLTITYRELKQGLRYFAHPWSPRLDTIQAYRLEIVDADGGILYRRTEVNADPLTTPLLSSVAAGFFTTVTYAGLARSHVEYSPLGPDGRDVLPALLGTASRPPDPPTPSEAK